MNNFLSWISLKQIHFLIDPPYLPSPRKPIKTLLLKGTPSSSFPHSEIFHLRNMTPTRTPTRRASLSVNTSSLLSIMEFSIPSEFTVPSAQGPIIPEDIDVIIRELQLIAIEQQPMTAGEGRILAKYQKDPDSPVLDLIANAEGEAFLF